jgi:hypothetical protein
MMEMSAKLHQAHARRDARIPGPRQRRQSWFSGRAVCPQRHFEAPDGVDRGSAGSGLLLRFPLTLSRTL